MPKFQKVGIIGSGYMGSAIAENLLKANASFFLNIFDKDVQKIERWKEKEDVKISSSVGELSRESDVVLIAVKPQDIASVLEELKESLPSLLVSIAAGTSLVFMESMLCKTVSIVRAMPNMNVVVGRGVTALAVSGGVTPQQKKAVQMLFETMGRVVFVPESDMNAVTAISGSGPAFVASCQDDMSFKEIVVTLQDGAEALGIEAESAHILAEETVSGTRANLETTGISSEDFIRRVCSRGGTTEAGMAVLRQEGRSQEALKKAIRAAKKRADELSRKV